MKNIIIIAILSITFSGMAQKNNPYNQIGIDYIKSIKLIRNDIDKGKIHEFDSKVLNYYSKRIPLKADADMTLVGEIAYAIKKKSHEEVISASSFTKFSKDLLMKMLSPKKYSLSSLVDEIKKNKELAETESELLLTSLAITNAILNTDYHNRDIPQHGPCTVNGQTGPGACSAVGAGIGAMVGGAICGIPCALGGAIIGGLIGSASD